MKPHILILFLILALPLAAHTATDDYTIAKKHRVIQEATLQPSSVPIGTELPRLTFTALNGDTHNLDVAHQTGTGRLRVPCNGMSRRTTLHDALETAAHRIRIPEYYLCRSLRQ